MRRECVLAVCGHVLHQKKRALCNTANGKYLKIILALDVKRWYNMEYGETHSIREALHWSKSKIEGKRTNKIVDFHHLGAPMRRVFVENVGPNC